MPENEIVKNQQTLTHLLRFSRPLENCHLGVRDDYEGEDDSQQDQEAAPQQQGNTAAADNQQQRYPHRSSRND